jgi:predicted amidohydrolase
VLLANRIGTDAGVTFCGSSAIIDPYGVVVAAASADSEELLLGEITADAVQQVRDRMPVLDHCRDELYC